MRLNYDKLQYKQEVEFFGEAYTVNGCKPAQSKVKAIIDMPSPTCKKQVQSFIGMVNYLSTFSACLSELAEPIRELSKEKIPFNWGPEHQDTFKLVKKEITAAPILTYYNPRKTTFYRQMQVAKDLALDCYRKKNQYILQARHSLKHKEDMWQ